MKESELYTRQTLKQAKALAPDLIFLIKARNRGNMNPQPPVRFGDIMGFPRLTRWQRFVSWIKSL